MVTNDPFDDVVQEDSPDAGARGKKTFEMSNDRSFLGNNLELFQELVTN
jgi:hypothetical protein